jgi:hypothetical protein
MLEFVCKIPEAIGWSVVGVMGLLCAAMMAKLVLLIKEEIEINKADDNAEGLVD